MSLCMWSTMLLSVEIFVCHLRTFVRGLRMSKYSYVDYKYIFVCHLQLLVGYDTATQGFSLQVAVQDGRVAVQEGHFLYKLYMACLDCHLWFVTLMATTADGRPRRPLMVAVREGHFLYKLYMACQDCHSWFVTLMATTADGRPRRPLMFVTLMASTADGHPGWPLMVSTTGGRPGRPFFVQVMHGLPGLPLGLSLWWPQHHLSLFWPRAMVEEYEAFEVALVMDVSL
ncbi:hypothetical protein BKA93DRAFT_882299 [Sparassis latifolia]